MRAMDASRTRAITAALMLAIGVAACAADENTSAPGELPNAEHAAPPDWEEWSAEAPKEAAEETPDGEGGPPAEPAEESSNGPGPPAAEPEEEEAPEADRE